MLFNNLAFFARIGFFRRGVTSFSKGVWQPCGLPTFLLPKAKIALRMTSASNYYRFMNLTPLNVRCFEVIYTRQQSAILQPQ